MQTEVEVKFLNVDHDNIREKLQANGAQLVLPMRTMKRAIMDYPDWRLQSQSSYVRVRDEGDKITLTYKRFDELSIDGAKEVQTHVHDYQTAIDLLSHLGLVITSTQETWQMGDCEVVLDEWPWLKPYIEIEGPDAKSLKSAANKLGFNWDEAAFGDVTVAYQAEYDINVKQIGGHPNFAFDLPVPDWLEEARLNNES